jgi:hypothetical protein
MNKNSNDMKGQLTIISDDLNHNIITEEEAKNKLLVLFGVIPCDHRYHSRNGRYMLYEDWCEKCGTNCHVV